MPNFIATCWTLSLDSKQLVAGDAMGRIRLAPTDALSIQRDLIPSGGSSSRTAVLSVAVAVMFVAFDPTCRFLAVGRRDGTLELRTL